jgi:hypothetical protein
MRTYGYNIVVRHFHLHNHRFHYKTYLGWHTSGCHNSILRFGTPPLGQSSAEFPRLEEGDTGEGWLDAIGCSRPWTVSKPLSGCGPMMMLMMVVESRMRNIAWLVSLGHAFSIRFCPDPSVQSSHNGSTNEVAAARRLEGHSRFGLHRNVFQA